MTAINQSTLLKTLVIGAILGVSADFAIAQQVASVPSEAASLDEVIVYAQKKSVGEAIQKVPIAEMAFSGQAIEQQQIQDLTQIGRLMPNVDLQASGTFPLYPNFNIRGVGNTATTRSIDPSVNIIQDGMVLGYQAGAVLDAFDMESVEVLRGPQGVLFGRNASGGAVVLRTPLPTADWKGGADLTVGNENTVIFKGDVGGPLVADQPLHHRASLGRSRRLRVQRDQLGEPPCPGLRSLAWKGCFVGSPHVGRRRRLAPASDQRPDWNVRARGDEGTKAEPFITHLLFAGEHPGVHHDQAVDPLRSFEHGDA